MAAPSSSLRRVFLAGLAVALVPVQGWARSDSLAIVVGVGAYENFPAEKDLQGPVSDALEVADNLEKQGFEVVILKDTTAQGSSIRRELKNAKEISGLKRFVFYFSGHGRVDPKYSICAADAPANAIVTLDLDGGQKLGVISSDELYALVQAIPSETRTVLLDCCFAGGMITKSLQTGSKVYWPENTPIGGWLVNKGPTPAYSLISTGAEYVIPKSGQKDVCYVVAATEGEQANEYKVEGGASIKGGFTHFLLKEFGKGLSRSWSSILSSVSTNLREDLKKQLGGASPQTPAVNSAYSGSSPFEAPREGPRVLNPVEIAKLYDVPPLMQEGKAVTVKPEKGPFYLGQSFEVSMTADKPCYAVAIGFTRGSFRRYYPRDRNGGALAVYGLVDSQEMKRAKFILDEAQKETLKVFFFDDALAAQKVIDSIPDASVTQSSELPDKSIDDDPSVAPTAIYALRFEGVPIVLGGYRLAGSTDDEVTASALKIAETLSEKDSKTGAELRQALRDYFGGTKDTNDKAYEKWYSKKLKELGEFPDRLIDTVVTWLNFLVQSRKPVLSDDSAMSSQLNEEGKDLLKRVDKGLTVAEMAKLNGLLLTALFPESLVRVGQQP